LILILLVVSSLIFCGINFSFQFSPSIHNYPSFKKNLHSFNYYFFFSILFVIDFFLFHHLTFDLLKFRLCGFFIFGVFNQMV